MDKFVGPPDLRETEEDIEGIGKVLNDTADDINRVFIAVFEEGGDIAGAMFEGALGHRARALAHHHRGVVVEGDGGRGAGRQRPLDQGDRLQREGLPAELDAVAPAAASASRNASPRSTERSPGSQLSVRAW